MKKYLVGGAVRDKLLGKQPSDFDYVVTGATEQDMLDLGYKRVGNTFPVFIDKEGNEVALARKEIKSGDKHTDFTCSFSPTTTIEEDLERRDLTVNAIAYDEESGVYVDPFNGISDINNKVLRVVSKEHFAEDSLRLIRVARFMTKLEGFSLHISSSLGVLINIIKSGELSKLSGERMWKELERALAKGCDSEKFFTFLYDISALSHTFPLLNDLVGVPERKEYHPMQDSFKHTMACLKYAKDLSPMQKFAVLVHDLGKAKTPSDVLPKHINHDLNGLDLIDSFCDKYRVPNDYKKFALHFCKYHMKMHIFLDMSLKKKYHLLKDITNNFKDNTLTIAMLDCLKADMLGEFAMLDIADDVDKRSLTFAVIRKDMLAILFHLQSFVLDDKQQARLDKVKNTKDYPVVLDELKINYLKHCF